MRGGISPNSLDNNMLRAYSDSSDCDDVFTSRSTGRYLLYLNGSLVSWQSKLQKLITLSSCKREYIQACLAAQEIIYMRD
eukprot:2509967-Rhodomonas_salina.2